jgi:hypothetical protein
MTATTAKTNNRNVKATVRPEGRKKVTFRFGPNPAGPGTGRAAAWMRKYWPIATPVGETRAILRAGGTLEVTGCTVADLYSEPAAGQPAPAATGQLPFHEPEPEPLPSKSALRKMTPAALNALAERRGLKVLGKLPKTRIIAMLVESR